ncbi:MAG: hydroxypyruvate isomerase [Rhodocyclaceae bacterium]|nr:hydroxypyruvate isomerase [Rhodocyclaceae bacterium]
MLRFSANISFLFSELPFLERFAAAREAGFGAVEFHFPYQFDRNALAEAVFTSELEVILFNLPAGTPEEWAKGGRGIACDPDRVAEFKMGVETAIAYASALGCSKLNCLAGVPPAGVSIAAAEATLISNLQFAAGQAGKSGIELMLEPLNTIDSPGFLISTSARALAIIDAVGSENLRLQYDVYHAQVMEGNLVKTLQTKLSRIGHIQIADNPGRHEPGTGEINFPFLFSVLDQIAYRGWIGCEYIPSTSSGESLSWLKAWLKPALSG